MEICRDIAGYKYSIQMDETVDVGDMAQVSIFARYINHQGAAQEKLLGLVSRLRRCTAEIIFDKTVEFLHSRSMTMENCAGVTTDGAPATIGFHAGVATLLQSRSPSLLKIHCALHAFNLACESFDDNEVSFKVNKIIKKIRRSPLIKRQLRFLLMELDDAGAINLPMWNEI